jgi:DNA polymerase III alpha subunit
MSIPLFKSHYSIGKSILTLRPPSKAEKGGADSIIDIALDAGLKEVVLIEDTMHGFLEAKKRCDENNLQLIFGIRVNMCQEYEVEKDRVAFHKIIVIAKSDAGIKKLYKIYSYIHCDQNNRITEKDLKTMWNKKDLMLAIPFYDSFIYQNNFKYEANFMHNLAYYNPIFFIENNHLPVDALLKQAVEEFTAANKFKTEEVKSIYYRNRKDLTAFQTYKMITSRSFGRKASIQAPNLDGCGSEEFCMESWLDAN